MRTERKITSVPALLPTWAPYNILPKNRFDAVPNADNTRDETHVKLWGPPEMDARRDDDRSLRKVEENEDRRSRVGPLTQRGYIQRPEFDLPPMEEVPAN